ncbi:hypothetical protein NEFER03_0048 [Nematocida sp. LUAm3]|nr:hypothetical protein NEFER03_0048 [Nematocida sp. LUAm3]KAI5176264.1 hypothetical protein NEFER02_2061 [Nematocida sp. LUAm2]KAI5176722.1 hypothetical protein NEFER01_0047 [Nematocida sp. LUAm1]
MIGIIVGINSITCSAFGRELVRRTSLIVKVEDTPYTSCTCVTVNIFSRESLIEEKLKADTLLIGRAIELSPYMIMQKDNKMFIRAEIKNLLLLNRLLTYPPLHKSTSIANYCKLSSEEKRKVSLHLLIKRKISKEILQCIDRDKVFCEILLSRYTERSTLSIPSTILLSNIQEVLPTDKQYREHPVFSTTQDTLIEHLPVKPSLPLKRQSLPSIKDLHRIKEEGTFTFQGRIIKVSPITKRISVADHTGGVSISLPEEQHLFKRVEGSSSLLLHGSLLFSKVNIQCTFLLLNKRLIPQDIIIQE